MLKYLLLFWIELCLASNVELSINTQHSQIQFEVEYLNISTVSGSFKDFKGSFLFNTSNNEISDLLVEIPVQNIFTSDVKRDHHLKSKDFLDMTNYPNMIFSLKGPMNVESQTKMLGKLQIKNIIKNQEFLVEFKGRKKDSWGNEGYFFKIEGQINRKDFGIVWNRKLDDGGWLVGDIIKFKSHIEAQPIESKPAFSRFYVPEKKNVPYNEEGSPVDMELNKSPNIQLNEEKITSEDDFQIMKYVIGFFIFFSTVGISLFVVHKFYRLNQSYSLRREVLFDSFIIIFFVIVFTLYAKLF